SSPLVALSPTALVCFPFLSYYSPRHRDLHSFPTRRSSDLQFPSAPETACESGPYRWLSRARPAARRSRSGGAPAAPAGCAWNSRSEEHTSELQSRENLVCRLLLEKKKK